VEVFIFGLPNHEGISSPSFLARGSSSSRPSRHQGLHLQGHLGMEVFIFKAFQE
jgi:hypothetical protein